MAPTCSIINNVRVSAPFLRLVSLPAEFLQTQNAPRARKPVAHCRRPGVATTLRIPPPRPRATVGRAPRTPLQHEDHGARLQDRLSRAATQVSLVSRPRACPHRFPRCAPSTRRIAPSTGAQPPGRVPDRRPTFRKILARAPPPDGRRRLRTIFALAARRRPKGRPLHHAFRPATPGLPRGYPLLADRPPPRLDASATRASPHGRRRRRPPPNAHPSLRAPRAPPPPDPSRPGILPRQANVLRLLPSRGNLPQRANAHRDGASSRTSIP